VSTRAVHGEAIVDRDVSIVGSVPESSACDQGRFTSRHPKACGIRQMTRHAPKLVAHDVRIARTTSDRHRLIPAVDRTFIGGSRIRKPRTGEL
jgi:hypothetical protein